MLIRDAVICDLDDLVLLNGEVQSVHIELFPKIFRETDQAEISCWLLAQLEQKETCFYVAELAGKVIAYLTLTINIKPANPFKHQQRYGHIDQFCVSSAFRQTGVGRKLVCHAIKAAKKHKLSYVGLDVWTDNGEAKAAFKSMGFDCSREHMRLPLEA